MRERLLDAPRWLLSLIMGVPFGVAMAVTGLLRGDGWQPTLILGALAGLIFGVITGRFLHRQYRRQREALGGVPVEVARAADRATWRGPVPQDPEVRAAAVRHIDHQLAEARRWRTFQLVVFIGATALYVALAFLESPGWWTGAAFFALMLTAVTVLIPRRLQRRAEMLRNQK